MLTHEELKTKILNNPEVKDEYDSLQNEFALDVEEKKVLPINDHFEDDEDDNPEFAC
jgi:hypothetical protein